MVLFFAINVEKNWRNSPYRAIDSRFLGSCIIRSAIYLSNIWKAPRTFWNIWYQNLKYFIKKRLIYIIVIIYKMKGKTIDSSCPRTCQVWVASRKRASGKPIAFFLVFLNLNYLKNWFLRFKLRFWDLNLRLIKFNKKI